MKQADNHHGQGEEKIALPAPEWWRRRVNSVAEVQFFLRWQLRQALENYVFVKNEDIRKFIGDAEHWLEFWESQSGQEFFDMTTLVRLATTVETLLRDYYRSCLGHSSISGLAPKGDRGVFQRLFPWSQNNVMELYAAHLNFDLTKNVKLRRVQELMAHRHLYGHSSGLVTDEYLDNWKTLTGEDLSTNKALRSYPDEDVFWFKPLEELDDFIEDVRGFFRGFPTSA
jgi:hypothetical protein